MSKCKYYRGAENETRVPSCGVEAGEVYNTVHPEDAMEREYRPFFCGGNIRRRERKQHPDLVRGGPYA